MTELAMPAAPHSPVGPAGSAPAATMAGELVADVLAEHPALGCWRIGTGCWRRRGWRYLTATTVFLDGGIMQGSVGL